MFITHARHRSFSPVDTERLDGKGIERRAAPAITILALAICWWALIETTLDFVLTDGDAALAGTIGTRLIVVVAALAVVVDTRFARPTFSFLCAVSVLAVGPRIPLEFTDSLFTSAMSFIDCASKMLFLAYALGSPAWSAGAGKGVPQASFVEPRVRPRDEAKERVFHRPPPGSVW